MFKHHRVRRFAVRFAGPAAAALFVGMLFWAKLRVVETIPRSAYADPDPEQASVVEGVDGDASDATGPDADGLEAVRDAGLIDDRREPGAAHSVEPD
jgi:hypothetical protein